MPVAALIYGGDTVADTVTMNFGRNFKFDGKVEVGADSVYVTSDRYVIDSRNDFVCEDVDLSNWGWYINYLDYVQEMFVRNSDCRVAWLVNLGYVPVVYMPSCFVSFGAIIKNVLDRAELPYITWHATSMTKRKIALSTADAWVSKMDAAVKFGVNPEDVTSNFIIKELFKIARQAQ